MNTATPPTRDQWCTACDYIAAANALPAQALSAAIVAELRERLEAFAQTPQALRALPVCNPELLLNAMSVTYFLRRTAPGSALHAGFDAAIRRAISGGVLAGTEVAAHYAIAYAAYATALGAPPAAYCALDTTAFRNPFYLVRPRAVWDRSDFRRALYAARLPGADAADAFTDLLAFDLVDAVRNRDATETAWLLVAWTADGPLAHAVLGPALRLIEENPPDPLLARLATANIHTRLGKEPL